MKKIILIVFVILLCSFAVISAQDTVNEVPVLSFHTVGEFFSWGDSKQDVYDFLSNYKDTGLVITVEEDEIYGKTINAEYETDDEYISYYFYFDDEKEGLNEIECVSILDEGVDVLTILSDLIETYGLENAEPYENDVLDELVEEYGVGTVVAGDSTIIVIAVSPETDESYATAAIYFFDREYFEANY